MLKKLLKYEFKATARTYGGMYLALLAASVLFGGSVRRWNGTNSDAYSTLVGLLSLVYTAVIIGTVVVTIMTIVQRFYRNLLGREGYLMHTTTGAPRATGCAGCFDNRHPGFTAALPYT